jgi:hypothetical protein
MNKLGVLLSQYGALALVVAACWGWGEASLRLLKIDRDPATRLGAPLAITLGLGIGICVLQGLAIAGQLSTLVVGLLIAIGMLLAARLLCRLACLADRLAKDAAVRSLGLGRASCRPAVDADRAAAATHAMG